MVLEVTILRMINNINKFVKNNKPRCTSKTITIIIKTLIQN